MPALRIIRGIRMVEKKSVTILVSGMSCAMCVKVVEKSLRRIAGVTDVAVNLATEKAMVSYDGAEITTETLKKTVEDAGYTFIGIEDEKKKSNANGTDAETLKDSAQKLRLLRVGIGFVVSAVIMALQHLEANGFALLDISLPVFIFLAWPIFSGAYRALRNMSLNMDVMYALGTGTAFGSSLLASFGVLPSGFYFYDTALMLASFLMLGKFLENMAKSRTGKAIEKLLKLRPDRAVVIRNNAEITVRSEEVAVGDIVKVRTGERVPADGVATGEETLLDESMLTGEPLPVLKKAGDKVTGGTLCKSGILIFRATAVGAETTLAGIIRLVEKAQSSKAPVQRIADRVVSRFIPVILALAALTFTVWFFAAGQTALFSLTCMIAVLVVACPCALGLATPTAVAVGLGRGAELGILIKNAEVIETLEKADIAVFDKTGTLTEGKPEVTEIHAEGIDEKELIRLTASLEKNAVHPLAGAILEKAKQMGATPLPVVNFRLSEGLGLEGAVESRNIIAGSRRFLEERGVKLSETVDGSLFIAIDGLFAGSITVRDTLKFGSLAAITQLKKMGVTPMVFSGDGEKNTSEIAAKAGIASAKGEMMPAAKLEGIQELQKAGHTVVFIGDGINDAPALSQADAGIALGTGTDIAAESGDAVIMSGDLPDAVAAFKLARAVMARIRLNLFWAFAYNMVLVPLAAGLLYPLFGILFRPELAGLAMALSSVTVIMLSLDLRRFSPR